MDKKNRNLINFLDYYPNGTMFLKSVDPSNQVKSVKLLCESFDSIVMEVGQENVMQIVTDNEANYVSGLRTERYPAMGG